MIKILFFAALRERLNCEQYLLSCDGNILNVAAVLKHLQSRDLFLLRRRACKGKTNEGYARQALCCGSFHLVLGPLL